jgi:hypothetical protein
MRKLSHHQTAPQATRSRLEMERGLNCRIEQVIVNLVSTRSVLRCELSLALTLTETGNQAT